jgi:hypothetical protein
MYRNRRKILQFGLVLCAYAVFVTGASAQHPTPKPPAKPAPETAPKVWTPKPGTPAKEPAEWKGKVPPSPDGTYEKKISVDPNVNIKFCVNEGELKINGWDRDEVRVFVRSGRQQGFKVLEKDPSSGKANWLWIMSAASETPRGGPTSDCLSGEGIEMDVPVKATLSISGRATETTIDTVKKVGIKNVEGNISLRNITGGISAATYQGDLMVENSGGAVSLESTSGSIVAFEVTPGQIGDLFKAKTNSGTISLQRIDHRQIEANTISGSVHFNGKFLPGGMYNFKTSNGAIVLAVPKESSCKIVARYGFGSFKSALPFELLTENDTPGGKFIVATLGKGESATVNLTTSRGAIGIKNQEK